MIKKMGMGINLGNTLEAPLEGAWAPKATQTDFDQYKAKGFSNVRIPIRWDNHTARTPPYTVDEIFMAHVEVRCVRSVSPCCRNICFRNVLLT